MLSAHTTQDSLILRGKSKHAMPRHLTPALALGGIDKRKPTNTIYRQHEKYHIQVPQPAKQPRPALS